MFSIYLEMLVNLVSVYVLSMSMCVVLYMDGGGGGG